MKATQGQLESLHSALLKALTDKLKRPKPSAENLTTARQLLKDALYVPLYTPASIKRLDSLHEEYVAALKAALAEDRPSPAMLRESREFMKQSKIALQNQRAQESWGVIPSMPFEK